jgi:hypothetical protein
MTNIQGSLVVLIKLLFNSKQFSTIMKQFYTVFVTFTHPIPREHFYLVTSSAFLINDEDSKSNLENIFDRFEHSMFKHYTLLVVEELEKDSTVQREQEFKNLKVMCLTPEEFFTKETTKYFLNNLGQDTNLVIMFRSTNWQTLLEKFETIKIVVSGGSANKRHLISPAQVRLIEFLKCWFGFDIMRRIVESHYSDEKELRTKVTRFKTQPNLDFAAKIAKNKKTAPDLTPFSINGQNKKFHISAINCAEQVSNNNNLITINLDPN